MSPFAHSNKGKPNDWFGVVGCGSYGPGGTNPFSLPPIPADQTIPNAPDCGGPNGLLPYAEAPSAAQKALDAAKALKGKLIEDGTCKEVGISIQMTDTYKKVLQGTKEGQKVLKELNPYLRK